MAVDLGSGAWEVADIPGLAGVASEVRAGLKTLSSLFRGRPVLAQAGFGVSELGSRCSGRVARGDGVTMLGDWVRRVPASSESGMICGQFESSIAYRIGLGVTR